MTNERNDSLLQAQFRAVQATVARREGQDRANPVSQVLTTLMRHGGIYSLTDSEMMAARMAPLMMSANSTTGDQHVTEQQLSPKDVTTFVNSIGSKAASFFQHLVTSPKGADLSYPIPSSLMSHIAFPIEGVVYRNAEGGAVSPDIPAAFTFVGQFIDHDLTMNAVNLFEPQQGVVQDTASPLIDLDSVYGPRTFLTSPSSQIYNDDGSFKLNTLNGYVDLTRDDTGSAYISDKRNDENQMILQVHLLIVRVHNKLISMGRKLEDAYQETLFNWQSVLLNDYLSRILDPAIYADRMKQIEEPDFGDFKYKPLRNLTNGKLIASMPHEFAIGFRFGHSQLRSTYHLQPGGPCIKLFDNSLTSTNDTFSDLRGSQKLVKDHVIHWPFFAGDGADDFKGNAIDSALTRVVADLPESAIPDDIKYIGNLAHRNLIRSRQVGLCAGEDLAAFYGYHRHHLPIEVIEPDPNARHLYMDGDEFRTPLWFYILKEAEHAGTAKDSRLGKVGSSLVGEVILGAIKWAEHSVLNTPAWESTITKSRTVKLLDLAKFVS